MYTPTDRAARLDAYVEKTRRANAAQTRRERAAFARGMFLLSVAAMLVFAASIASFN